MRHLFVVLMWVVAPIPALCSDYVQDREYRINGVTFEELFGIPRERAKCSASWPLAWH